MGASASPRSVGLWALALGITGFVAGFFGPIALNPDANQGPLVGIFITGPGGALAGLILGVVFRLLPVSDGLRMQALLISCAVLGLGTLFFCLPEPAVLGYVIDAEVAECDAPTAALDVAVADWEGAVARTTWYTPPPDWKQTAMRNVEHASGVLLTMRIARRAAIYQHRKPWNRRRKSAGAWTTVDQPERYYADDAGGSCGDYLARARQLYMPFSYSSDPTQPAPVWPPTEPTAFLRLMQLGPVPAEYQRLLPQ